MIFLAALQSIPGQLYEAARIDGASNLQQFRYVTLPSLAPTLLLVSILSVAGYMQLFAEPWLITQGGPGNATETLGTYLYKQGFRAMNFGYASTVAYAMALMAALFSAIQITLFGRHR